MNIEMTPGMPVDSKAPVRTPLVSNKVRSDVCSLQGYPARRLLEFQCTRWGHVVNENPLNWQMLELAILIASVAVALR